MSSPLHANPSTMHAREVEKAMEEKLARVCICCQNGEHGSHLIGGARCECPCHPSSERRAKKVSEEINKLR